jgi:3-oxoadipate enol-lactonase
MSFITSARSNIYYESHGEGPPLVFIHGAGAAHLTWWQQVPAFSSRNRVIVYDQRGFGASRARDTYDVAALTADLVDLLDALEIGEPISLVGHSLGSFPALDFAERYPERTAKLVMACGYGALDNPERNIGAEFRQKLFSGTPTGSVLRIKRSPDEAAAFKATEDALGMGIFARGFSDRRPDLLFLFAAIWQMSNGPSLKELGSVIQTARCIDAAAARNMPVPVLVVGGKEDPCFPPAEMAAAAAMFAHGTFVQLKGAAHVAIFECADDFNEAVADFLAS